MSCAHSYWFPPYTYPWVGPTMLKSPQNDPSITCLLSGAHHIVDGSHNISLCVETSIQPHRTHLHGQVPTCTYLHYYWTPLNTSSWLELTILSPPETSSCFACTASMSEPNLSPRVVPPFWSCYAFPNGWNHQQPH